MTFNHTVIVEPLLAARNVHQEQALVQQLMSRMAPRRPYLVLDCSGLESIDKPEMRVLLNCLAEALKRNGDVRLAGVSKEAMAALESTGVAGLFRIFSTSAEAAASYHTRLQDFTRNRDVRDARDARTGSGLAAGEAL